MAITVRRLVEIKNNENHLFNVFEMFMKTLHIRSMSET